eukprot:446741-Prymnesium_polylepis.1
MRRLEELRSMDEKGETRTEQPKQPTVDAFAKMGMGKSNTGSHWSQKQCVVVHLPDNDQKWASEGSITFKRFRDEPALREKMTGWSLTIDGMTKPAGVDPNLEVRPAARDSPMPHACAGVCTTYACATCAHCVQVTVGPPRLRPP